MGSIMKKVKERSEKSKNLRTKAGNNANKRNIIILAVCVVITVWAVIGFMQFINSKNDEKAVEFVYAEGAPSTKVSKEFLNLLIAEMKHNGISLSDDEMRNYAVESASLYLETEFCCDNIYMVSLDEQQQNSIDEAINRLIEKHGSENKLDKYLSKYGTDTEAVRRYFELRLKQENVIAYLDRSVTLDQMKDCFAENYMSGSIVVLYNDQEHPNLVQDVYGKIVGGELTLDEARELYSIDKYKDYKAFYVSNSNVEGINQELFAKITSMKEGEISFINIGNGGYIIEKNPADTSDFTQNEVLYEGIKEAVRQQLYKSVCDTYAEGISVNDLVVRKINPSKIPALNTSSLTDF